MDAFNNQPFKVFIEGLVNKIRTEGFFFILKYLIMNKTFFIGLVIHLLLCLGLQAQETHRVPKNYALELGYRYLPATTFDIKNAGPTVLFDYAWQLSGFSGKPASFITVPLGYTFLSQGESNNSARILSYGWTVRHHLSADRKAIPYVGYGLLLNQLRMSNLDGSVFGHQTRFDFGYLFTLNEYLRLFAKLEYSYTRYPRLGLTSSDKIHAAELKVGLRFNK